MVDRNAQHEAPHAWTNGFLGVGSRLGADVVCSLISLWRLMVLRTRCVILCSVLAHSNEFSLISSPVLL